MLTLLLFSFLAGFITILAPCIWPLLPIVFSASSTGGKRKSLGITLGVMVSFTIFTLFISYIVKIFPINPNELRLAATIIIASLGLSLLIPSLGARFEVLINNLLGPLQSRFEKEGTGLTAGLVTGFSLGLVWAPCAGPILATIATLSATQSVNAKIIAVTMAYVLGLGIPLYLFSLLSARAFAKMRTVNKYTGIIQQIFGAVMIVVAILIYSNYAQALQARVLNLFPGYSQFLGRFENNAGLQKQLDALAGRQAQKIQEDSAGLADGGAAPDFSGIAHWFNTLPLTMHALKGKVVLIDFWTYTCINCVRTLPHLTAWYEHYKDQGLVIVGVHTPEFAFEKETQNVANAIMQFNITYPVAQDNDYGTWSAYQNHYWPAEYLIDARGHIRKTHFGEGHYNEMEQAIRDLLKENGADIQGALASVKGQVATAGDTPETYLGANRMSRFASPEKVMKGLVVYSLPSDVPQDHFGYQGQWDVEGQFARSGQGAALEFKFHAKRVFLVVGPVHSKDKIKVFLDGQSQGDIILDNQRLYPVVDLKGVETHLLRLEFPVPGTAVYAFTFG